MQLDLKEMLVLEQKGNITKFALLGNTGSFTRSFNPSAIGWNIPKIPTTFGPFRRCIEAKNFSFC